MARRRFALIGQSQDVDLSGYLTTTGGTLTGNLQIDFDGEFITLKNTNHTSSDNLLNTWIRWKDSAGTDMAWIGFGSNSHNDLGIYHSESGKNIRMGTTGAGDVLMGLGATGALEITGSSYKVNPTGLRLGQYSATQGYIQAPAGGSVAIWTDGTGEIARFDDDGSAHVPQGTLQLGKYSTTSGGVLKINGTTINKQAELQCTNGNLHIDSHDGQYIYLNYYSNTAGTYVSANGGFASTTQHTGEFGSVQTFGSKGGYGGINLGGGFALMNSGTAHVGLYNDVNNEWMILAYPNSYLSLYYNGVQTLTTRNTGVSISGGVFSTPNGTFYGSDYIHHATTVKGGALNNNGSSQTGYLRINLPTEGSSNMGGFTIRGYNYNSRSGWAVRVDYYEYTDGNGWVNEHAKILYGTPPFDIVRFGTATGSNGRYILCGTSTTAWAYAQICLTDFFVGYSGQYNHLDNSTGWTVDISASTPTGWAQESSHYVSGQLRWNGESGFHGGGAVSVQSGGSASGGSDGDIILIY